MTEAIISLGSLGLLFGILLTVASMAFSVEADPKEEKILDVLPGANCGACGYPGCSAYAAAVASGEAQIDQCPVGGPKLAAQIGSIMGREAKDQEKITATVRCRGDNSIAKKRYDYEGISNCNAANVVAHGFKGCIYGCLGLGDCVDVCEFDAIHVNDKGLAVVNEDNCVGCRKCVTACPRDIIYMDPGRENVHVLCNSNDRGASVRKVCEEGCIACGICERNCPTDAIKVIDNLAVIDYDKCINCGLCAKKCPMNTISKE